VFSGAFTTDGSRVITASADGTARIWNVESGRQLLELNHCDGAACPEVRSAAFGPDSRHAVTGTSDGIVRLWDAVTGALMKASSFGCAALPGVAAPIASVSFSPEGAHILTSSDRDSRLWHATNLEPVQPCLGHEGARNLPVFGRDPSRNALQVVTTSTTGAARVWDVRPEPVVRWELPRDRAVLSASVSNDGLMVTASQDGTARIWNGRTGKETGLVLHHGGELASASFSHDGARILTLGADGVARIWDLPAGAPGDAPRLAELAEAISGHQLDPSSAVLHLDSASVLASLRSRSAREGPNGSFASVLTQWLFADPMTRTISPLSRITVPE
jgi:WD40 repeat protein